MSLTEWDVISGPAQKVLPVQFPGQDEPRRFTLTEQTPADLVTHYRRQDRAKKEAVERLEKEEYVDDSGHLLATAMEVWLDLLTPAIVNLLSSPADGKPPATLEEVQSLTERQKTEIINRQDELSGLPEALGNGFNLLKEALPRRVADWILSFSESEQTSPPPATQPTP